MTSPKSQVPFIAAAFIMISSILLYDVMGAIVKHLSSNYSTPQLAMFRNIFGLVPTIAILGLSQSWKDAGRPIIITQWRFALLRGGIGAFAQISIYFALANLEFATATALLFSGPLFITALSIPILGHTIGLWRWLAVVVGFMGVLLVLQPNAESFSFYAVLPLCAAFGFATTSVTSRLFDKSTPTALINLYYNVGTLAASIVFVIISGGFLAISSITDWLWLAAMGAAGGTAAFCRISAYRLAEPSSLSPFEYFAIPFSFALGWFFFAEAPFERLMPGVFLIIAGGLAITFRERAKKKNQPTAPS